MICRGVNLTICALCMAMVPISGYVKRQEQVLERYLITQTDWLKARMMEEGRLSKADYENYKRIFEQLNGAYTYQISIAKPLIFLAEEEPEKRGQKVRQQVYPQEELQLFAETEETAHIHTMDCYPGHNHVVSACEWHSHTGTAEQQGGCYQTPVWDTQNDYHTHTETCMTLYEAEGYVNLPGSERTGTCEVCGRGIWVANHSHPCGFCNEELGILVVRSCGCEYEILSGTVGTHRHLPYLCGYAEGEITGTHPYIKEYAIACGKREGWQCGLEGTETALCSQIMQSIWPQEAYQVFSEEQVLNTTVVVNWLNGEQSYVEAEVCGQWQEAEELHVVLGVLGYCDTARSLEYDWKYCEIIAVKTEQEKFCEYGHSYAPSLESCPECAGILTGMRIELLKKEYQPGEELVLRVFLQYQDGREAESSKWSSDYQPTLSGEQEVMVYCEGLQQEISVIVSENRSQCEICGEDYEVTEGVCPYCYMIPIALSASGSGRYGEAEELEVYLIFRDGHRQRLLQGYTVEGYQPYQPGEQWIRVHYQELSCELMIYVSGETDTEEEEKTTEPKYFEPEHDLYEILYQKQLEEELCQKGEILFEKEVFFNITVKKCNIFSIFSVIYSEGIFTRTELCYMTGGEIGSRRESRNAW